MLFITEWREMFSNLLMTISSLIPIVKWAPMGLAFKNNGTIMFTAEKVQGYNRFDERVDERDHLLSVHSRERVPYDVEYDDG